MLKRLYLLAFLFCGVACKTTSKSVALLDTTLLELADTLLEGAVEDAIEQSIQSLQFFIAVDKARALFLTHHPTFHQLTKRKQRQFRQWYRQQTTLSEANKQQAHYCLTLAGTLDSTCLRNPILDHLANVSLEEAIRQADTDCIQLALDNDWVPDNEAGNTCNDVRKGHFYFYLTNDHQEVAYIHRTDSTQQESWEDAKKRRVTWLSPCTYRLSALEAEDDFRMDFEIVYVASDHYIYLCHYSKQHPSYLMLGRINKSLE